VVKKYDVNGYPYHEPPYTEEEILETARRANGGVVAFRSLRHPRRPQDPVIPSKGVGKSSPATDTTADQRDR
jgi:hypothetical protein